MLGTIKGTAKKFTERYFQNCHSAWLVGSFTTDNYNEESDIDIIILSKVLNQQFIENFDFEGFAIQALVFPFGRLHEVIRRDYEQCDGIYISMLETAILIKGSPQFFDSIKQVVNHLTTQGPKPYKYHLMRSLRFQITSKLIDLKSSRDANISLFIIFDLFQYLVKLNLIYHNQWIGSRGKHLAKLLSKCDPTFYDKLTETVRQFSIHGKARNLVELVTNNLKKFGGELHFYSTNEVLSEVKKDQLVIQFRYKKDPNMPKLFNEVIGPMFQIVGASTEDAHSFLFRVDENSSAKEAVYIAINEDKQVIQEYLIPLIEQFVANNEKLLFRNNVRIVFPSEYNPGLNFGYSNSIQLAEKLFSKLALPVISFYSQDDNKVGSHFTKSIFLLFEIGIKANFKRNLYRNFLEEIFTLWLPRAIDLSDSYNEKQLHKKTEKVKVEFSENYSLQKDDLEGTFLSYIEIWKSDHELAKEYDDFLGFFNTVVETIEDEQVLDNFYVPRFIQIKNLTEKENIEMSYYLMVISRMFECLFISDENKVYVVFVTLQLLNRAAESQKSI